MDHRRRVWFMHDQRVATEDLLARTLWLQGLVDQAAEQASACLEHAIATENSLTICEAIRLATGPIMLATGDLDAAERAIMILMDHATHHDMTYWWIVGSCLQGDLLIRRGNTVKGVALLGEALTSCERTGWAVCYPAYKGVLADGLLQNSRRTDALSAIDLALSAAERGGERWAVPELLRVKGACMLEQEDDRSQQAAEQCFRRALDVAKQQNALFWELRVAMDFARLRAKQGRREAARRILAPVFGRFTEGLGTVDLKTAKRLLAALN
jgi:predicted ATPase